MLYVNYMLYYYPWTVFVFIILFWVLIIGVVKDFCCKTYSYNREIIKTLLLGFLLVDLATLTVWLIEQYFKYVTHMFVGG